MTYGAFSFGCDEKAESKVKTPDELLTTVFDSTVPFGKTTEIVG